LAEIEEGEIWNNYDIHRSGILYKCKKCMLLGEKKAKIRPSEPKHWIWAPKSEWSRDIDRNFI
jgi:hypothetical protein